MIKVQHRSRKRGLLGGKVSLDICVTADILTLTQPQTLSVNRPYSPDPLVYRSFIIHTEQDPVA